MYFLFLPYLSERCKTIHDLAIEGTNRPLNDGHGHVLLDESGNPILANTKSEKLLAQLAKARLPEFKDNADGNSSNTININFGDVTSTYYIGIDLKTWHVDEVTKLKALVQEVENRK